MPHREEMRVPSWYSAALHYVGTTLVSLPLGCAGAWGLWRLPSAPEGPGKVILWVWALFFLFLASGVEYLAHRFLLHQRWPILGHAFVEHTLRHHRWFDSRDIEARAGQDFHQILFPLWGVILLQYGVNLPICLLVGRWFGTGPGALGLCIGPGFFFLYETVHALCHFPSTSAWFRVPGLARLREHHRIHHDPVRMSRANFNIVLPLWDALLGTRE